MKITRSHQHLDRGELNWTEKEAKEIRERIINLRPDQIGALTYLIKVEFSKEIINSVVSEIKENGHNSVNIDPIVYEADSRENLLWWIDYFEKENKNQP